MQNQLLTEIPSELKQLARLVVRGFYDIEYSLIVDMLVRYHCIREEDLCDLLKFDKKVLRAKLATLKSDKFLVVKLKIETAKIKQKTNGLYPWIVLTAFRLCVTFAWGPRVWVKRINC